MTEADWEFPRSLLHGGEYRNTAIRSHIKFNSVMWLYVARASCGLRGKLYV